MPGRRRRAVYPSTPVRTSTRAAAAAASAASAAALRTPTPVPEPSDSEMQDAPSGEATPQETANEQDDEDGEAAEEELATSPAAESDVPPSRSVSRAAAARAIAPPVKRRPGRPPKNKPPGWDDSDNDNKHASDAGTPKRRGGFRGRGFGGGRWKNRGGPTRVSQVPLDKEGNMATVRDDEIELPEDPEGETKVDKMGRLQGGREYRVRTFTIQDRGERLYMLSTEPARCIGFRDSYLFFQKHKQLFKIILPEEAKHDLIDRNLIPHSYKGRAIGVVTARSVFREFGAKIVIGGRKIIDDYQVAACRANGDIEGELAVPDDVLPPPGQEYDRNRYVAWHGASAVYHAGMPTIPLPNGKSVESKKRRVQVTGSNWMLEHARESSRFNSFLAQSRRANNEGVYELHTNHMHYPMIMQPTHAKWEELPRPPNSKSTGEATLYSATKDASTSVIQPETKQETIFPPLSDYQYRNFATIDTVLTRAPFSIPGVPGTDDASTDLNLHRPTLLDVPDDVAALLPPECRAAFEETKEAEKKWKHQWTTEAADGMRAKLKITYSSSLYA